MARISKAEKELIRVKIIDIARVSFKDNGFEDTSTKKIAKEVGIAEGTLFNYFDSKTELFFEALGKEYSDNDLYKDNLVFQEDIVEAIYTYVIKVINSLLKVPKPLMSELATQSLKFAKKKPKRFRKLIELDYEYMRNIESFVEKMLEKGYLKDCDAHDLSEIIFSIIMYEVLLYMYMGDTTKEELRGNIKRKIAHAFHGYLVGGKNDQIR